MQERSTIGFFLFFFFALLYTAFTVVAVAHWWKDELHFLLALPLVGINSYLAAVMAGRAVYYA